MITYEGRDVDPLAIVHQETTGLYEVRAMREEAEQLERDGQLSLYVPGVTYLSSFRESIKGMSVDEQAKLGTEVTKFMDDEEFLGLGYAAPRESTDIMRLDMPSLGIVLRSHVDGMAVRQLQFERRYHDAALGFRDNVHAAITDGRIPWYAANNLSNVNYSQGWTLDRPAMKRIKGPRTAALVYMGERHVLVRDESNTLSEQQYMHHEMVHLISSPPAEHQQETVTYPHFGLYHFPVRDETNTGHRWVNEAMTEHANMLINGYKSGSYVAERTLLGSIFIRGKKGIERRALNAFFANDEAEGMDVAQAKLDLYYELSEITRARGLGDITDIAKRTEEIEDLAERDVAFMQYSNAFNPDRPFDQDAAIIDLEQYRRERGRRTSAAGEV